MYLPTSIVGYLLLRQSFKSWPLHANRQLCFVHHLQAQQWPTSALITPPIVNGAVVLNNPVSCSPMSLASSGDANLSALVVSSHTSPEQGNKENGNIVECTEIVLQRKPFTVVNPVKLFYHWSNSTIFKAAHSSLREGMALSKKS